MLKELKEEEIYQIQFRHYGSDTFDPYRHYASQVPGHIYFKPIGFWSSPILDEDKYFCFTWDLWCKREEFELESLKSHFDFKLDPSAKIIWIHTKEDVEKCIGTYVNIVNSKHFPLENGWLHWNEDAIHRDYDGMMLYHGLEFDYLHREPGFFNLWDVDSLVLWHLDKVIVKDH